MTPTPLSPQVQEWRKEAMTLAEDYARAWMHDVDGSFMVKDQAPKAKAKLLAHLDAVPFNQVVQEPTVRFKVVQCNPSMRRLDWLDAGWWDNLAAGEYALYAQPVRGEALPAEQPKSDKSYALVAVGEINKTALPDAAFVRDLLWNEHTECCGSPVAGYGGEYMGQREEVMSCCGCPEPAPLNDAQIVATLRARFPNV